MSTIPDETGLRGRVRPEGARAWSGFAFWGGSRRSGWRNTGLDCMAATEVNARWQRDMAPYFTELDGLPPDQGFKRVGEIFHVD